MTSKLYTLLESVNILQYHTHNYDDDILFFFSILVIIGSKVNIKIQR